MLDRQLSDLIAHTFITPGDVFDLANKIKAEPVTAEDIRGDVCENALKALRWVHENITYVSDFSLSGQAEYWQEPYWTVRVGHGDCDDMAFLLASILMVYGGDVRVVYGTMKMGLHVWVEFRRDPGAFVILEATNGAVYRQDYPLYRTIEVLFDSHEWTVKGA